MINPAGTVIRDAQSKRTETAYLIIIRSLMEILTEIEFYVSKSNLHYESTWNT